MGEYEDALARLDIEKAKAKGMGNILPLTPEDREVEEAQGRLDVQVAASDVILQAEGEEDFYAGEPKAVAEPDPSTIETSQLPQAFANEWLGMNVKDKDTDTHWSDKWFRQFFGEVDDEQESIYGDLPGLMYDPRGSWKGGTVAAQGFFWVTAPWAMATLEAYNEAKSVAISLKEGKEYRPFKHAELVDVMPDFPGQDDKQIRAVFTIVDLLLGAGAMVAGGKGGEAMQEKVMEYSSRFFRDLLVTEGLPSTLHISASRLRAYLGTSTEVTLNAFEKEMWEALDISQDMLKEAMKHGIDIPVPVYKFHHIKDKAWLTRLKRWAKRTPYHKVEVESPWEVVHENGKTYRRLKQQPDVKTGEKPLQITEDAGKGGEAPAPEEEILNVEEASEATMEELGVEMSAEDIAIEDELARASVESGKPVPQREPFAVDKIESVTLDEALEQGIIDQDEGDIISAVMESFPQAWQDHFVPEFTNQTFGPSDAQLKHHGVPRNTGKDQRINGVILTEKMGELQQDAKHIAVMFGTHNIGTFFHEFGHFSYRRLLTGPDKKFVKAEHEKAKAEGTTKKDEEEWYSDNMKEWWYRKGREGTLNLPQRIRGIYRRMLSGMKKVWQSLKNKKPGPLDSLFEDIITNGREIKENYFYSNMEMVESYVVGSEPTQAVIKQQGFTKNAKTFMSYDPSTMCPKQDNFINFILERLDGYGLNIADLADVNVLSDFYDLALQEGIDVPCSYCYVENARRKAISWHQQGKPITGVNFAMAKKIFKNVPYRDRIMRWSQKQIDEMNKRGGLRLFSFSDYIPEINQREISLMLDHAKKRGLSVKAITKVPQFVEDFGDRGITINLSIDAQRSGGPAVNWDKAAELKKKYPNVKVRTVAANVNEVEMFLNLKHAGIDNFVDVVTAYHHDDPKVAVPDGFEDMSARSPGGKKLRALLDANPKWKERVCCQVGGKCFSVKHNKQCASNCGLLEGNLSVPSELAELDGGVRADLYEAESDGETTKGIKPHRQTGHEAQAYAEGGELSTMKAPHAYDDMKGSLPFPGAPIGDAIGPRNFQSSRNMAVVKHRKQFGKDVVKTRKGLKRRFLESEAANLKKLKQTLSMDEAGKLLVPSEQLDLDNDITWEGMLDWVLAETRKEFPKLRADAEEARILKKMSEIRPKVEKLRPYAQVKKIIGLGGMKAYSPTNGYGLNSFFNERMIGQLDAKFPGIVSKGPKKGTHQNLDLLASKLGYAGVDHMVDMLLQATPLDTTIREIAKGELQTSPQERFEAYREMLRNKGVPHEFLPERSISTDEMLKEIHGEYKSKLVTFKQIDAMLETKLAAIQELIAMDQVGELLAIVAEKVKGSLRPLPQPVPHAPMSAQKKNLFIDTPLQQYQAIRPTGKDVSTVPHRKPLAPDARPPKAEPKLSGKTESDEVMVIQKAKGEGWEKVPSKAERKKIVLDIMTEAGHTNIQEGVKTRIDPASGSVQRYGGMIVPNRGTIDDKLLNALIGDVKDGSWVWDVDKIKAIVQKKARVQAKAAAARFMKKTKPKRFVEDVRAEIEDDATAGAVDMTDGLDVAIEKVEINSRRDFNAGRKQGAEEGTKKQIEIMQRRKEKAAMTAFRNKMITGIKDILKAKNVHHTAMDRIKQILVDVDMQPRGYKKDKEIMSSAAYAEKLEAMGEDHSIPDDWLNRAKQKPIRKHTMKELQDLHDEIQRLAKQGKLMMRLLSVKDGRDFDAFKADLIESLYKRWNTSKTGTELEQRRKGFENLNAIQKFGSWTYAQFGRQEFIFKAMDGWEESGPWQDVFNWSVAAENAELKIIQDNIPKMENAFSHVPAESYNGSTTVDGISEPILGSERLAIALNAKNPVNRETLINGWDALTAEGVQNVVDGLSPEERFLVDTIHEIYAERWPNLEDLSKELFNFAPPKVDGYYPLLWEKGQNLKTQQMESKAEMKQAFNQHYPNRKVEDGFMQERKGGRLKVRLDPASVISHFKSVAHYETHMKPMRDIRRLLYDTEIQESIKDTLGEDVYKAMVNWVQYVSSPGLSSGPGEKVVGFFRKNTTMALLGGNVLVSLKQILSFGNTVVEIGKGYSAKGLHHFGANPWTYKGKMAEIQKMSPYMMNRKKNLDLELADYIERMYAKDAKGMTAAQWRKTKEALFEGIRVMDAFATGPTWMGAFKKEMDISGNMEAAIEYADKVVRTTQPSASPKDLPYWQRQSELNRALYMFSTARNVTINKMVEATMKGAKGAGWGQFRAMLFWSWILPSILMSEMESLWKDRKPASMVDLAWDVAGWWFKLLPGTSQAWQSLEAAARKKWGATDFSAIGGMIGKSLDAMWDLVLEFGEYDWWKQLERVGDIIAPVTGFPSAQYKRTLKGSKKYFGEGEGDWMQIFTGPVEDKGGW
jgi:hypothetical protein